MGIGLNTMNLSKMTNIKIRKINISDAENYMKLLRCLDGESNFLYFEKNERDDSLNKYSEFISKILSHEKAVILVAESGSNELIGFICGELSNSRKRSHMMTISMGVLKKYQLGLGRRLLEQLLVHARSVNVKRVEAYIMETNKKSLNLAKKFGFEIEGIKKASINTADGYINEYLIGLVYE